MGLGMPKSDQLWPPGPLMTTSRRREASAIGGDVIGSSAIENDHGFEPAVVGIDEGAHAAEIAFAFFANVSHKENRALRFDLRFVKGSSDGRERGEARSIVRDAGREHAAAIAAHFDFRSCRENCVEMRGEHDEFFFVYTGATLRSRCRWHRFGHSSRKRREAL